MKKRGAALEADRRARAAAARERQQSEQRAQVEARQEKQQQRESVPGTDPLTALGLLATRRRELDEVEARLVEQLRAVGVTWAVIGRALGVSGQAVSMRYRSRGVE